MSRDLRLSQTVTPFGVGAIYDIGGESLIGLDTTRWGADGDPVRLDRLADELGVRGFRSAPADAGRRRNVRRLPFMRFPRWLFCPKCRGMVKWRPEQEVPGEPARCRSCPADPDPPQLVPMRFVVVCEDGHLDDVWWPRWAHSGVKADEQTQCRGDDTSLQFLWKPEAGAGLSALAIRCTVCGCEESLDGITSGVPHPAVRCRGGQPWEPASPCTRQAQVVQRGASNVYFAEVRSAIDIPPSSDHVADADHAAVLSGPELSPVDPTHAKLLTMLFADETGLEQERAETAMAAAAAMPPRSPRSGSGDLRRDEWDALRVVRRAQDPRSHFVTRHEPMATGPGADAGRKALEQRIDDVVLVTRLREVRALKSFRRLTPEGAQIRPSLDHPSDWLPAIEVFGEGVFMSFDEASLEAWERRPQVVERVAELEERRADSFVGRLVEEASPRFVMLHTFAHLLIRRLSFESGYTAASLRERIYSSGGAGVHGPMAGVLVYTAAGDAEGTLGGLVRQGRSPQMAETILAMLQEAAWCSSDPICIESRGQGFEGLNRGACHACTLLSETSCEYTNALLDRALVVGRDGVGLFEDVLDDALKASAVEP